MRIDYRLKQIFKSTSPFGGISILVFGDLKQLPPVGDRWIFSPAATDPYSVIHGTSLWDKFKFFELSEIMRQREDQPFAIALNNLSCGSMSVEDISLIRSRVFSPTDVPREAIHLFLSNNEVDVFNAEKLNSIQSESIISSAKDNVKSLGLSNESRNRILESVSLFKTTETQGLPGKITLKVSGKYMITVNLDIGDGLVNGATGTLMQVDCDTHRNPTTLWVNFPENCVGVATRAKKCHPRESNWTPLEAVVRSFQFKKNEHVTIDRTQFPIVPAEGITVHKSQGATYACVAVHLKSRMNRSALYVACSRATQASGLYLIGNFIAPKPFADQDAIKVELSSLRTNKHLTSHYDFFLTRNNFKVVYQNVESLHAHINDVRSDNVMLKADILCFVETWSLNGENYDIPGYIILPNMRLDSSETATRNKRGIIIYVRTDLASELQYCDSIKKIEVRTTLESISFKYKDIKFFIFYRNNNFPIGALNNEIDKILAEN